MHTRLILLMETTPLRLWGLFLLYDFLSRSAKLQYTYEVSLVAFALG